VSRAAGGTRWTSVASCTPTTVHVTRGQRLQRGRSARGRSRRSRPSAPQHENPHGDDDQEEERADRERQEDPSAQATPGASDQLDGEQQQSSAGERLEEAEAWEVPQTDLDRVRSRVLDGGGHDERADQDDQHHEVHRAERRGWEGVTTPVPFRGTSAGGPDTASFRSASVPRAG